MQALKSAAPGQMDVDRGVASAQATVTQWTQGLAMVEKARAATWPATLVKVLGDAARAHIRAFEADFLEREPLYVNITALEKLCDEMTDIAFQLDEVGPEHRDTGHSECFDLVLVWLPTMDRAHARAHRARLEP
jgi:hypothetical protein